MCSCFCAIMKIQPWLSILPSCRFWPEHIRQRVNSTYTYFASGLGVTAMAAYTATRATSVMRFMATRPIAVSGEERGVRSCPLKMMSHEIM